MNKIEKDQLITLAKKFDKEAKCILPFVDIENYGEWFSEYTENFFKVVGKTLGIDYNSFADTIFDDHPKINNSPIMKKDNKLIWNNEFGFENYGLKRTLDNIENCNLLVKANSEKTYVTNKKLVEKETSISPIYSSKYSDAILDLSKALSKIVDLANDCNDDVGNKFTEEILNGKMGSFFTMSIDELTGQIANIAYEMKKNYKKH